MLVKSNEFESEHRIGTRRLIFHISVFVVEIALTFGKIEKQRKIDRGRPFKKEVYFLTVNASREQNKLQSDFLCTGHVGRVKIK